jgi:hypothetical protein
MLLAARFLARLAHSAGVLLRLLLKPAAPGSTLLVPAPWAASGAPWSDIPSPLFMYVAKPRHLHTCIVGVVT